MLSPAAVAYVFPYKLLVGPALVIVLALTLVLLVKKRSLKARLGNLLILLGAFEGIGCLWVDFLEGFVIGLCTLFIGLLLAFDAWRPPKAALLSKQKRGPPKIIFAAALLAVGAGSVLAGLYVASFAAVVSGFAVMVAGGALCFNFLATWIKRQQRLKNSPKLRKIAYLGLSIIILISGLLISLRATNVLHEQRLENWSGTSVNLTVQGTVSGAKYNYEVNNGHSYHVFAEYFDLNVTKVLWVNDPSQNLTNAAEYWTNQTIILCNDLPNPPHLTVGESVEANGYYNFLLGDSVYSEKLIVAPSMNESYIKTP